jgi:hypothetical protein
MDPFLSLRIIVLSALFMAVGAVPSAAAETRCLDSTGQQSALNSGQVAPLPRVLQRSGLGNYKPIGPAQLCKQGDEWVYRLKLLDSRGDAKNKDLPAGK